jgi:hypothetical protein
MTGEAFPIVKSAISHKDLSGPGWWNYRRLEAIKLALDDLAADIVRAHLEADGLVDHACLQFSTWLRRESEHSFAAAAKAVGAFDAGEPAADAEYNDLLINALQYIGATAVETRRRWNATGLGGKTTAEALESMRWGLHGHVESSFGQQKDATNSDGQAV